VQEIDAIPAEMLGLIMSDLCDAVRPEEEEVRGAGGASSSGTVAGGAAREEEEEEEEEEFNPLAAYEGQGEEEVDPDVEAPSVNDYDYEQVLTCLGDKGFARAAFDLGLEPDQPEDPAWSNSMWSTTYTCKSARQPRSPLTVCSYYCTGTHGVRVGHSVSVRMDVVRELLRPTDGAVHSQRHGACAARPAHCLLIVYLYSPSGRRWCVSWSEPRTVCSECTCTQPTGVVL
jgi:hypothetical protein